ncbi:MAG: hypothetical protein EZS28_023955 [Streblomastix strix]|uniref:Uncharacterized protein n=1 Tax=Streblomastix strix TaxID=222440 RepID=A0A5J4VDF4_9EUKA|nr:MAG: hypothetical protein EZS28_023955 [Streblomastix strix]
MNLRYNKVGLVEQVQNINQQITILQNIPQSYDQEQFDALLLLKADKTDIIEEYSKTEDDALLLLKVDKSELIYSQSNSDDYALLLLKSDKSELIDLYTKTETDSNYNASEEFSIKVDLKANLTVIVDNYLKIEDDVLLLLFKADNTELFDAYFKSEDEALLSLKADKIKLVNYISLSYTQTITRQKQFSTIFISKLSKLSKYNASMLLAGGSVILV